jgi:hypothetical protein
VEGGHGEVVGEGDWCHQRGFGGGHFEETGHERGEDGGGKVGVLRRDEAMRRRKEKETCPDVL